MSSAPFPAWSFEVHQSPRFAVDVSSLDPASIGTVSELLKLTVRHGSESLQLGELVRVEPSPDGLERWTGDLRQFDGIGSGNTQRQIEITGTPGRRIGAGMSGGLLRVAGAVGDDLGLGLSGGTILVTGACGARAGGYLPGANAGMRGGMILVGGDAGPEAGQKMRRGLLAIAGTAQCGAAQAMIAGTLIAGSLRAPFGLGLRRGTIICRQPPIPPAWFGAAVAAEFSFTRILARSLRDFDTQQQFCFLSQTAWNRAQGDRLERNQGELLWPIA